METRCLMESLNIAGSQSCGSVTSRNSLSFCFLPRSADRSKNSRMRARGRTLRLMTNDVKWVSEMAAPAEAFNGQFYYQRTNIPVGSQPRAPIDLLPLVEESRAGWSRQQAFDLLERIPDTFEIRRNMGKCKSRKFRIVRVDDEGDGAIVWTVTFDPNATNWRIKMHVFDQDLLGDVQFECVTVPIKTTKVIRWYFRIPDTRRARPSKVLSFIGTYILRYLQFPDKAAVLWLLGERAFTKRTVMKWMRKSKGISDFHDIVDGLPGFKEVVYTTPGGARDSKSFYWKHGDKVFALEALVWIPTTAVSVIASFCYYQLDASFYVFHPYVYTIPMMIQHNTGFPLGLIIGRAESAGLYGRMLDGIRKLDHILGLGGELETKFRALPVLSDKGSGLARFCTQNGITQYNCHRHIIEEFGSASIGGFIARLILRTESMEEFKEEVNRCNGIIYTLEHTGRLSGDLLAKYCRLTHQKSAYGRGCPLVTDGPMEAWESAISSWAIWQRGPVANTTNIQESLHGKLNGVVKHKSKKGVDAFSHNVEIVVEEIDKRQSSFGCNVHRNLKDSFVKYCGASSKKLKEREVLHVAEQLTGDPPVCDCHISMRMQQKWNVPGTPFPCSHMPMAWRVKLFHEFEKSVTNALNKVKDNIESIDRNFETNYVRTGFDNTETDEEDPRDESNKPGVSTETIAAHSRHLTRQERAIAELSNIVWATLGRKGITKEEIVLMVTSYFSRVLRSPDDVPCPLQITEMFLTIQHRLNHPTQP